ncbi:hypothetical protein CBM2592_A190007 [Cupriavidus taiwanensis]|nr:hypothetical protein CBM2592_A190007 [Cupriavidus taiwanensis]SOY83030.1 hypothetical protein CBM2591_A230008 [Cupriavidus taiwanensis]SOZ56203.1 hypothetical protein CBM2617_A200015 [Cupriavidus taiwanensis]SOZ78800.1 hypothetical protein CBM2618_A180015 [Cupriavidus taiwanensis]SOZ79069.1 hypothetical protein CBM2622_A170014 [Cupriavidus taiwanensis]
MEAQLIFVAIIVTGLIRFIFPETFGNGHD